MAVEPERGVSVSSGGDEASTRARLQPARHAGHQDFSEDSYRTLTAVDSAVMVLDAAKGIEEQTRKLFEVCRLRDVPIITFVNKLDREGCDPFDLLDEIEQSLALDVTPARGRSVSAAIFSPPMISSPMRSYCSSAAFTIGLPEPVRCSGLDDPKLSRLLPKPAPYRTSRRAQLPGQFYSRRVAVAVAQPVLITWSEALNT
jgi:peptide chain release factor 3